MTVEEHEGYPFEDIIKFDNESLSPLQIDFAERVFRTLDKDNNGFIEPVDMKAALDCTFLTHFSALFEAFTRKY